MQATKSLVDKVKSELTTRLTNAREQLESGKADIHDRTVGLIQGYKHALNIVTEQSRLFHIDGGDDE